MKLEAVDPKHPSCICVVSIVETQGARLRLHFDGWSESYDFWTNSDSHLLFPAGFCSNYEQKLHPPRGSFDIISNLISLSLFNIFNIRFLEMKYDMRQSAIESTITIIHYIIHCNTL